MAVHSDHWWRVATLKPRLAPHVRLRRQLLRGESWIVLADETSGRSVRLNRQAYAVAGRFDGRLSVQAVWEALQSLEDEPATQDEVVDLLVRLREAALIDFDRPADFATLLPHLDRARPKPRFNPIAWRLPLGNPTRLLERLRPVQRLLSSPATFVLWLAGIAGLLLLGVQQAPALWDHAARWMTTPRYALLAVLLYIPIKLVHELAHGMAVRRWGGQVHEAGITLMMGLPVPYVNASAASSFTEPRQRIAVSAAGIMAELAIASVALPLWLWLEPGLARDIAFVTLVVTTVSTLLFNANPLQRLDGYYIATDWLELPNLGPRSRAWWFDWLRRRLLRLPELEPMPLAPGERAWLVAYAPLSWLYTIVITTVAVLWLGGVSLVLGAAAAVLLIALLVVRPVFSLIGQLARSAQAQRAAGARLRLAGGLLAVLLAGALLLPMPHHQLARGVVWPADRAQLRAGSAGFVGTLHRQDGDRVEAGELVVELLNPKLRSDHTRQLARVSALESELFHALAGDAVAAAKTRSELAAAQSELAQLDEKLAGLAVRAQVAGRLALPAAGDLAERYVAGGQLLGQVLTGAPPTVRVALPEDRASDLGERLQGVSVRLADAPAGAWPARLLRDSIGAVPTLPNAALSQRHGGDVVTDPQDPDDRRTLRPVVLLDVQLLDTPPSFAPPAIAAPGTAGTPGERIGVRAWVRFDQGRTPLALQFAAWLQRLAASRFNPQF